MNFLYSVFFGAGVAAVAYTRLGRRAGYGNSQNVWMIVGVVFVLTTLVFYTMMRFVLNIK